MSPLSGLDNTGGHGRRINVFDAAIVPSNWPFLYGNNANEAVTKGHGPIEKSKRNDGRPAIELSSSCPGNHSQAESPVNRFCESSSHHGTQHPQRPALN